MIKKAIVLILFLCVTSAAFAASKERSVKRGNAFYKKGDYAASLKSYQNALKAQPDSPVINFNLGTALYKDKKYDEAVDHLQKSLLGEDSVLQKKAHFNLGNALYQQGMTFGDGHIDQAIAALTESLRHFETVMNVDDKDPDAGYNHTIVQKELERLKKEKQQQNQQNKDQKQQNQKKDQQQQGSDKDQKQHDQNKEEQQKPGQSQEENSSSSKSGQQKQSSESSQKNNQDESKNQDQQKPQQGFSQNQEAADKSQQDDKESAAQAMPGQMTQEEAKSLLKQFEQGQESVGLLNFGQRQSVERPVLKDW